MMRLLPIVVSLAVVTLMPMSVSAQDQAVSTQPPEPVAPVATAPAPATNVTPTGLTGDSTRGQTFSYTCKGCHGVEGYKNAYPNYHVPKIGGQSFLYLYNALTAYKAGTRQHPTMQAQAQSFSDQDIADLALYLSEQKP